MKLYTKMWLLLNDFFFFFFFFVFFVSENSSGLSCFYFLSVSGIGYKLLHCDCSECSIHREFPSKMIGSAILDLLSYVRSKLETSTPRVHSWRVSIGLESGSADCPVIRHPQRQSSGPGHQQSAGWASCFRVL